MTHLVNESKTLIEIEDFVYDVVNRSRMPNRFYEKLTDLIFQLDGIYNHDFYYSAYVDTLIELLIDFEKYLDHWHSLYEILKRISFIEIKEGFKKHHRRHLRQLRDHHYSESVNTRNLVERMEQVVERYSRILVVRVDLAYLLKHQNQVGIQAFNDDMDVLRTRLRDKDRIFAGLIEYAWALEQGKDKGYHCHLLLVYKGSEHQKAYGIAKQVGELWGSITSDKGYCFNCHDYKYLQQFSDLNRLGIGMIYRKNQDQVNNMLNTIKYLVRPEKENQHLRVKCKKRMRTFG
ncbi:inovirus-type Gp2 protein [Acinetobacter sp. TAC-1]|uniref:YagK/YfjJ domain-containing protein n=1 Tax=Acinetobacter sp. TAC-1 TaxID=3027470 RepID=UPI0023AA242D|nr:inovirus-type Gp2 protein [Acinetobacter sp. TAC-1]WEE39367.1 inovirus-type Gp2 protein [Acinetobacter sp. TAC-1]